MGLQEGMGRRAGGGKRLKWIRGALIETGEKGRKKPLLKSVHTEAGFLSTHTHALTSQGEAHLRVTLNYSDSPR